MAESDFAKVGYSLPLWRKSLINRQQNMIETIGTNAGLVWNALNQGGEMGVKALKKATKIKTEKDVYAALGWLAKEGKLAFTEKGADVCVSLL